MDVWLDSGVSHWCVLKKVNTRQLREQRELTKRRRKRTDYLELNPYYCTSEDENFLIINSNDGVKLCFIFSAKLQGKSERRKIAEEISNVYFAPLKKKRPDAENKKKQFSENLEI